MPVIFLGLIIIVVVALAVVAAARPWARNAAHICTAENPMPAGGTDARWYHPDTDSADENNPRRRRCRHCGLEIDYAGD